MVQGADPQVGLGSTRVLSRATKSPTMPLHVNSTLKIIQLSYFICGPLFDIIASIQFKMMMFKYLQIFLQKISLNLF